MSLEVDGRLTSIQQSVTNASAMLAEITVASQQQSLGIEQIRQAVQGMDRVTQSNVESADSFASAADALNEQASSLEGAIGELQLLAGNVGSDSSCPRIAGSIVETESAESTVEEQLRTAA
jgi:methyl-accepting chemotaxis protein